ncbi:tetratricopeptide repeat protein [Chitinispirillales bacterium ANBcel5]|uniref:tetratricopeptide repeat protein n=1 Tax=Cellulosispirillum alkaliphilum TaxID=3039283 RepID=UPI002A515554|nr:tetratricopeptide repeat protein [Chitinispirillales bacterium ANBcel5]
MKKELLLLFSVLLFNVTVASNLSSEIGKRLIYDEKKGILYVDEGEYNKIQAQRVENRKAASSPKVKLQNQELLIGRGKDPPEVYFESGMRFFQSGDYTMALKAFSHAESVEEKPRYILWVGKTHRQLGNHEKMLEKMDTILASYPDSDVADDALFEIAFFYQSANNYERAIKTYNRLAEQYPFGKSYLGNHDFLQIAREQTRYMRSELLEMLRLFGFNGEDLIRSLRLYQQKYGLIQNGKADQETVNHIKKNYKNMLLQKQREQALKMQVLEYQNYLIASGIVAVFLIVINITLKVKTKEKKLHLALLKQNISDIKSRSK